MLLMFFLNIPLQVFFSPPDRTTSKMIDMSGFHSDLYTIFFTAKTEVSVLKNAFGFPSFSRGQRASQEYTHILIKNM